MVRVTRWRPPPSASRRGRTGRGRWWRPRGGRAARGWGGAAGVGDAQGGQAQLLHEARGQGHAIGGGVGCGDDVDGVGAGEELVGVEGGEHPLQGRQDAAALPIGGARQPVQQSQGGLTLRPLTGGAGLDPWPGDSPMALVSGRPSSGEASVLSSPPGALRRCSAAQEVPQDAGGSGATHRGGLAYYTSARPLSRDRGAPPCNWVMTLIVRPWAVLVRPNRRHQAPAPWPASARG